MATKFNLTTTESSNKMSSFKELIGKRISKSVKFMGSDVIINKLSVSQVMEIQEKAKEIEQDEIKGLGVLRTVISMAVEGAAGISEEDFAGFPMEELSKLSAEIMKFSGIENEKSGK